MSQSDSHRRRASRSSWCTSSSLVEKQFEFLWFFDSGYFLVVNSNI